MAMANESKHSSKVDMDALFAKNKAILDTHNISGAKVLFLLAQDAFEIGGDAPA